MSEPFGLGDSWIRWLFSDGEQSQGVLVEELKSVRLTIRQFTGLTDKNGVEIYEGDVLELRYRKDRFLAEVTWSDEFSAFVHSGFLFTGGGSGFRVIGNIYQHPELIEEKR